MIKLKEMQENGIKTFDNINIEFEDNFFIAKIELDLKGIFGENYKNVQFDLATDFNADLYIFINDYLENMKKRVDHNG